MFFSSTPSVTQWQLIRARTSRETLGVNTRLELPLQSKRQAFTKVTEMALVTMVAAFVVEQFQLGIASRAGTVLHQRDVRICPSLVQRDSVQSAITMGRLSRWSFAPTFYTVFIDRRNQRMMTAETALGCELGRAKKAGVTANAETPCTTCDFGRVKRQPSSRPNAAEVNARTH